MAHQLTESLLSGYDISCYNAKSLSEECDLVDTLP